MVTIGDAREVVETLKGIDPYTIIIFGSVARKNEGNDLDIVVVFDTSKRDLAEKKKYVNERLKPYYSRFAIDPFVFSLSTVREHEHGSIFFQTVFNEGIIAYMKNALVEWKKQADEELSTAEYLLKGGFSKSACYHAQQAAEKYIKAELLGKGWQLEKIHNIRRLLAIAEEYKIKRKLEDMEIDFLDEIYRGRYPAEAGLLPLGEPGESDARKAITIVKKLMR